MNLSFRILTVIALIILSSCHSAQKQEGLSLNETSISELHQMYSKKEITVAEVVSFYLSRINDLDKGDMGVNSLISLNPDALTLAREMDKMLALGHKPDGLFGIPIVLKDNIETKDSMPTTAGSLALKNNFAINDSWVAKQLRESGAIILGKSNLSEWANFRSNVSSSGWSGVGGQTNNPYILSRNPCGSSSGTGAAVSANFCVLGVGTETDGSIVCPSSANGIVGIKPTVGLISRSGIVPISETQDTPGPMARNVKDAVICLNVLKGIDLKDPYTNNSAQHLEIDYTKHLNNNGLKGKRIGVFNSTKGKHNGVDELFESAQKDLIKQGAVLIEIDKIWDNPLGNQEYQLLLFEFKDGVNKYLAKAGKGASVKNLDELIEFNAGSEIESRFDQGILELAAKMGEISSSEYLELKEKLTKAARKSGLDKVMSANNLDAIISPTGSPAWKTNHETGDQFLFGTSSPAAIAGYPNISVPMGFSENLPVGLSIYGLAYSEPTLIEIAYAYEQATMHRKAPKFIVE